MEMPFRMRVKCVIICLVAGLQLKILLLEKTKQRNINLSLQDDK